LRIDIWESEHFVERDVEFDVCGAAWLGFLVESEEAQWAAPGTADLLVKVSQID